MRCVKIKDQNADFGKPRDWDDAAFGPCGSLPIRREVIGTGGKAFLSLRSNWKPSDAELAVLNAGGCVELECCGGQPAVSVGAVPCADPDEPPMRSTLRVLAGTFMGHAMYADPAMPKEVFAILKGRFDKMDADR